MIATQSIFVLSLIVSELDPSTQGFILTSISMSTLFLFVLAFVRLVKNIKLLKD